jgi:UDP-GlcNAc:undecaprenyl-phosphate GlcNAc-1-phosphate transferase
MLIYNSQIGFYLLPPVMGFLFSLILTPIVKKIALKSKIVDYPGPRKIHTQSTPLLGGLAVFLSFFISAALFWTLGYISDSRIILTYILAIFGGSLILMVGGFFDDYYNLKPRQQLLFPLLAIALILFSGIRIKFITNPLGGILVFPIWLGVIFTFFWLLGMIYTTKILDGLDGLVAGITAIASIIIFIVSLTWDVAFSGTSVLALILAGSCLGFLIFNWQPAKIFLGEGGSVWCGFMLGLLAIISGSKIATALLVMGIPILDIAWVVIRRFWQGKSPVSPDRKHLHFQLLDLGLSHSQAVLFLYLLTAGFGLTSLFLSSKGKIIALIFLTAFMAALVGILFFIYHQKINENK